MTEIVQRWIQDRLGVLISVSPEDFADAAKDGHLLSAILKSYEIITQEQLDMIEKSNSPEICLVNFKDHIIIWLSAMSIFVDDEELFKIVNSKGTAALNLFYQVYLELCGNTNLYFITEQRLREKLRPKARFVVQRVKETTIPSAGDSHVHVYDKPLLEAQDIVHWQKDRMQMLQAKCKEAREKYVQYIRLNQAPRQRLRALHGKVENIQQDLVENEDSPSVDLSYEELIRQQYKANKAPKFTQDPQQTQMLLRKFRVKQREHSENLIFKAELQRDIFKKFWDRLKKEEEDRLNKNVTEVVTKQSLYERQIHQKVGEVKFQKHVMLENKRIEAFEISKQMEADFANRLVIHDKELDAKELTYYLEKERLTKLHNKLYEYKIQTRKAICKKICSDTVEDLVQLACCEAEYKRKIGEEPPRRLRDMWKKMFTSVIPFDSFLVPTEIILKQPDERPEEIEEIVHLEIDRQDMIDKADLESYQTFEWPWLVTNVEFEERDLEDMDCALNILGYIVHKLLAVKYPLPPLPPKPEFPNISVSACINGLDTSCLPVLQEILDLRQILVVQVQECIDYCLQAFIQETTVEESNSDAQLDDKKKKVKEKGKDNGPKQKKAKKGAKIKVIASTIDEELVTDKTSFVDKKVQTPRYYPDEEIPLTHQAELGKVAHEVLESGEPLTSFIVAAMFVEYLKSKSDIKGWVLINFPKTYEEAAVLEECLTGQPVPRLDGQYMDTSQSLSEMTELEEKPSKHKETDEIEVYRRSKILPQHIPPKEPDFYDTALTAYIKAIKKNQEYDKSEKCHPFFEDLEEHQDPLDKFYADLGCNYHFYYNRIDFNSTKSLAKLIVGDFSLPAKSSVEIFGEAISYIGTDKDQRGIGLATVTKKGEKKEKPKEKKPKQKKDATTTETTAEKKTKSDGAGGKGKKGKKTKDIEATKVVIVHEDKYTQAPDLTEESEEEVDVASLNPVNPGEKGWSYVDLPIPKNLQIAMATLWENAEEVYLVDMEQTFFIKRLMLNNVMPFVDSVKQHMIDYMNKPDEKQKYLREFQKNYNEFEDDLRNDPDFKAEMQCRISEMNEKLVEICEWKMIAADHERVFIIEKNWISRQLIQFVNNYISTFQLELDRFADTMMLLGDYYTAVVTKMPSTVVVLKEVLSKLELEHSHTIKSINTLLQNVDDSEEVVLHQYVQTVVEKCFGFVESVQPIIKFTMKKMKELFEEERKAREKLKDPDGAKDKKGGKRADKTPPPPQIELQLEDDVLHLSAHIMEEWMAAVRGETVRVKLRLELLKEDLFRNLDEVLSSIRKIFYEVYEQIQASYRQELDSINNVCKVLSLAVEREVKIQEELILDRGDFYVDPGIMLFLDALPPVRPLEESLRTGVFTINQLDKLVDILMDLSPSGYMPERSFLYLLQDLIVSKDEPILVPQLWRKIQTRNVDEISKYLFDDVEYVQWKDFIILNLMVPFPTLNEILEVRQAFRALDPDSTELVADYQFSTIKFWFEPTMQDTYRLKLMRRLLFKMYRVKADNLNYTALLLDFCKDFNPVTGLAKALTVSLGQAVCWEKDVGEHFVKMSRRKRRYERLRRQREQELKGGKEVVEPLVEQFMEEVLEICINRQEKGPDVVNKEGEVEQSEADSAPKNEEYTTFGTNIIFDIEPVPDLAYFLPLEVLLTIITTCLPWHARVQNIEDKSFIEMAEDIYGKCKHREFSFKVLCHEFLNHPLFVEQLNKTNKFSAKNPVLAVEEALLEKSDEKERHMSKRH